MEPKHYAAVVPLSDVGTIQVRAIRPDDHERLLGLFTRLTRRSIYFRFHEPKTEISQEELTRYTRLDFVDHVALVAVTGDGDNEKIVGVGRYSILPETVPVSAQVAFAVEDAFQGRGIGSGILKHLVRIARIAGIATFEGRILPGNSHILGFLEKANFSVERLGQIEGLDRYIIRLS
ncbi:GNAT family N-acetyltransferase [bacterium]|nr:GNAT family N-acetyltransferase [bacterium]